MKSRSAGKSNHRKPEKARVTRTRGHEQDTTIVAIGASAGGVEALTDLMNHLAPDTGMAFVLVQHLDPKHHSILTELLARKTAMSVTEVSDGLLVEPNHVYVIPPNATMSISDHTLHLGPREESHGAHMSVDHFMRALAEQKGNRATACIRRIFRGTYRPSGSGDFSPRWMAATVSARRSGTQIFSRNTTC